MSSYGRRDLVPLNKKAYAYDAAADLTNNLNDTLRNVMNNRTIQEKEMKMPKSAVIETVRPEFSDDGWRVADKENNIELIPREYQMNGVFDVSGSPVDTSALGELIVRLHQCLRRSQDVELGGRKIMLPADMLPRMARDILRMSENEPYGIRGLLVNVSLKQGEKTVHLGKVESTSYVAATFVVNITVQEDVGRWNSIKELVLGGLLGRKELYLAPEYTSQKQKLYRSSSPTNC